MQQPAAPPGSRPVMDAEGLTTSTATPMAPEPVTVGVGVGMREVMGGSGGSGAVGVGMREVMGGSGGSGVVGVGMREVMGGCGGSTRRTSRVWRYFGMVDNCHYICRLCSFVGAYTNTTNMRKHIQHHHPERFQDILDHTRPTQRPFYTGAVPRPRIPTHHYTQQPPAPPPASVHHYTPHGLLYPAKRPVLPKAESYLHPESSMAAPQPSAPPTCQPMTQAPTFPGLPQPSALSVCDLSPEETKLMTQLLPPIPDVSETCEAAPLAAARALPSSDERGGGDASQNNGGDEGGGGGGGASGSPEHFLPDGGERESTPPPLTPTHQKPESYQLRHNNHLTLVLEALARDESFMDVTLTAQGRSLKAHKSVLSAVSPYFRGVLRDNPCQHPIIIMPRDVRFEELYSIVNYIYKGEMTVAAEDLTSLLKTAEILQVSGLAPSDSTATLNPQHESSVATHPRSSSTSSSASSTNVPARSARSSKPVQRNCSTPPPRPKSGDSSINPTDFMDVDMTCVKEEVQSGGEDDDSEQPMPKPSCSRSPGNQLHTGDQIQPSLPSFSPGYDQGLQQSLPTTSTDQGFQNIAASTSSSQGTNSLGIKNDPDTEGGQQMCAMESPTPLVCPHCEEQHREIDSLLTHLRLRHPSKPSFTCGCGRVFTRQTYQQAHSKVCPNAT